MDMKKILQALDTASSKPVEGSSDMKKFVQVVNEGSNPHKVTLPVQMAMQHYQQPKKEKLEEVSVFRTYVAVVEDELQTQQSERKQLMRQYSQRIAESVLKKNVKESADIDLDNGFILTTTEFNGAKVPAVFDTQDNVYWIKNTSGDRRYGMASFIKIQNGKAVGGNPGKQTAAAMNAAGWKVAGPAPERQRPDPDASAPFVPKDYQTKEPLQKGPDGKWRNSKGEERDSLHGGPVTSSGTAMFRSLTPRTPTPETAELAEGKDTVKVPVTQKPRQGPLRPQTGAGKHNDKKKEQKQGKDKHKKPFYELASVDELEAALVEAEKTLKNSNPCWKGYKPVGTKKKNGRTVPNCVPTNEAANAAQQAAIAIAKKKKAKK